MADLPQVLVEPQRVVVGPWAPGCPQCLNTRRMASAAVERAAEIAVGSPDTTLPTFLADAVAELGSARSEPEGFWTIDAATLAMAQHRFLTDPRCPACSAGTVDSADDARVARTDRPKLSPESTRVRALDRDELARTYVDPQAGLIASVTSYTQHSFPFTEATMAVPGVALEAAGYGRTRDFESAWSIAVVESLERLSAYSPARRTAVTAAYSDIAADALDPRTIGLYPDERYDLPGFPYRPFAEDAVATWAWGHSFGQDRPVLVPESLVYYRHRQPAGQAAFACEVSSGNALGGCYEEAVLHGILELAERDAFLLTWYGGTSVPELDLGTVPGDRIPLVAERIERAGYRVHVFDTTQDHGIPTFWTMAEDVTSADRPKIISTGGSGLRPAEGILAALHELSQTVEYVTMLAFDPEWRARSEHLAAHPDDVYSMADHLLCGANPSTVDRYSFLLDGPTPLAWDQALERWNWPLHADIGADLDEAVRRFAGAGLDVIAVDTTTSVHTSGGFRCVKVIAPGTVPMTFGHTVRRVTGLPRLATVRNPHPHPFP